MVAEYLTIAEAARLIENKELSPVELVDSRLDRIQRLDGRLNSFIRLLADEARRDARAAEAEIAAGKYRGALHGIPIGLKDIYETAGVATTGHSKVMQDHVPKEDAFSVKRLRAAGAIVMGKLVTHEFALGGPSFDLPWAPARRSPRGSSSAAPAAIPAARSAAPPPIVGSPASSQPTASSAGWASCRWRFRSTMPGPWRGMPRTARSCCRRWRGTIRPIRRAPTGR